MLHTTTIRNRGLMGRVWKLPNFKCKWLLYESHRPKYSTTPHIIALCLCDSAMANRPAQRIKVAWPVSFLPRYSTVQSSAFKASFASCRRARACACASSHGLWSLRHLGSGTGCCFTTGSGKRTPHTNSELKGVPFIDAFCLGKGKQGPAEAATSTSEPSTTARAGCASIASSAFAMAPRPSCVGGAACAKVSSTLCPEVSPAYEQKMASATFLAVTSTFGGRTSLTGRAVTARYAKRRTPHIGGKSSPMTGSSP